MQFVEIARFNNEQDSSYICLQFAQMGINHKILKESEGAKLLVEDHNAQRALKWLAMVSRKEGATPVSTISWAGVWSAFPVTLILILGGILGYLTQVFPEMGATPASWLSFTQRNESFAHNFEDGFQIWRVFTPVFLHYQLLHILFNAAAIWELGRRMEYQIGSINVLLSALSIGIFSNCVEYMLHPNVGFGGLSGIAFGFIGMVWVFYKKSGKAIFYFPVGVYILVLISGLVGLLDLLSFLGVSMANGAHIGGLAAGLMLAYVYPLPEKSQHIKNKQKAPLS